MAGNFLATVVALGVAEVWLRRIVPDANARGAIAEADHHEEVVHRDQRREWVSVSMSLFAMTLINLVLNQADVMLLGILGDVRQAGQYATAARLASLTGFGLLAVNMILAPMITEMHATGQRQSLQRMLTRGARVALLAMLLCGAFMAVAGRTLLGWFGHEFREAYGPLLILLAGHAANTLGGSVGFLMTMTGHERRALAVIGGAAALNLVLHVALIPQFGMLAPPPRPPSPRSCGTHYSWPTPGGTCVSIPRRSDDSSRLRLGRATRTCFSPLQESRHVPTKLLDRRRSQGRNHGARSIPRRASGGLHGDSQGTALSGDRSGWIPPGEDATRVRAAV